MKRIVWIFGLTAGAAVSAFMAVSMIMMYKNSSATHGSSSMIIGYLSMLIAFSLIFVAVKNYRDKQQDGVISFGKAFRIGLFISLIASTMYVIVWALVYNFYMPDFMDRYTDQMMKQVEATATAAEVKAKAAEMQSYKDMYKNPALFALMTYAEILPVGLLVSLIAALILKRRKVKGEVLLA